MPARIRTGSTGDRKGRPYGGYGCGRVVFVGAHPRVASLGLRPIHLQPLPYGSQENLPKLGRGGPWASRQNTHRERWLSILRRSPKAAPAANFVHPGPQWGRKKTQASTPDFARRNHGSTNQEGVPRKKGSGERRLWARSVHRSRPRGRFGYFAAMGKVTRRPQAAKPSCEIGKCWTGGEDTAPTRGKIRELAKPPAKEGNLHERSMAI